ncbi:hypothetical protein [Streptomyces sp. NPDC014676]|uniref:hypothetical protein n=1 Tax=Streptomyces sp. NPDC014676 TaxID=3364879 RepID=UPI0036F6A114
MPGESVPTSTDTDHSTAEPPVPYRETTADGYARDFTREARALSVDDDTTVLSGSCPRCGCSFTFTYRPRAFRGPRRGPRVREIPVMCTCAVEHEGRPAGEEGCGAYWNVRMEHL